MITKEFILADSTLLRKSARVPFQNVGRNHRKYTLFILKTLDVRPYRGSFFLL